MRKALILLLFAWVPAYWYPAWGQSPSVGVDGTHEPKQKSDLATPKPEIGTKASPFVVETHARTKDKDEAAEAQRDKDEADRINRWMLRFAGAAALFTGLLVVVGGSGVWAALRTLRAIETQALTAKDSVSIAQVMAQLARLGVQATALGTQVAVLNAKGALQAAEAAKRNIEMSMSRERARVRVEFEKPVVRPHFVVCAMTNVGLTPAFLTSTALTCHMSSAETAMWPSGANSEHLGAGGRLTRNVLISGGITDDDWQAIINRSLYLLARAKIAYVDVFDVSHETLVNMALGVVVETWNNPATQSYYWYRYDEEENTST
jgi:hypothetical protein